MQEQSFAQSSGFFVEEMNGEILLYKTGTHKAVYLNETAALVWRLCDGTRTVKEIADVLGENFPSSEEYLARDVQKAVEMLLKEGALSAKE